MVGTGRIGQDAALRVSAGATRGNEFSSLRELAPRLGFRQLSFRGAVSADALVRISEDQEFELEATHSALDHMEALAVWAPIAADYDLSSVKARDSANTGIGQLQATIYTNFNHEVGFFGGEILGLSRVTFNNQRTDLQLQDEFKLGADHTFRLSAEYLHSAVNTSPIEGAAVGYNVGSASAMWQWQIMPELSLTTAARVDKLWLYRSGSFAPVIPLSNAQWQRQVTQPSFNVGLVYQPRDIDLVRLTAARGVQLPSLFALGAIQFTRPFLAFTGNPTINPTVVTNYELDWDHKLPELKVNTRLAVFYQTNDALQTLSSAMLFPLPTGILLTTSGNGWHWSVGYSTRLVWDNFLPNQPTVATGVDFQHTTPQHVVDVGAGWAGGNWEIDAAARFELTFDGLLITPAAMYTTLRVNSYLTAGINTTAPRSQLIKWGSKGLPLAGLQGAQPLGRRHAHLSRRGDPDRRGGHGATADGEQEREAIAAGRVVNHAGDPWACGTTAGQRDSGSPEDRSIVFALKDLGDDGSHDGRYRVAKEALGNHHQIQQQFGRCVFQCNQHGVADGEAGAGDGPHRLAPNAIR